MEHNPDLSREEFLKRFSHNAFHNVKLPSLKFPANVRMELLLKMGFTPAESKDILLSKVKSFSDNGIKSVESMKLTHPDYIKVN